MVDYESVLKEIDFNEVTTNCDLDPSDLIKTARHNPDFRLKLSPLVSPISKYLYEDTFTERPEFHSACEQLILDIAELGEPDDILMDFLEEAETSDSVKFKIMLKCFKICLLKINVSKIHPLCWCFNTTIRHINNVDLPADMNFEGKEKLLIDCDPQVISLKSVYEAIMEFIDVVIHKISPRFCSIESHVSVLKESFTQFLLKLLGKPLAYMDLESVGSKGAFRAYSEVIVKHISNLSSDLLSFLCFVDYLQKEVTSDDVVDFDYTNLSLGTFYYLILHEGVCLSILPQLYSPIFIFENVMKLSLVMFSISESLVQRKGLLLSLAALERLSDYTVSHTNLHLSSHSTFVEVLPGIMVYSEVQENRQLAVQVFKKYLFKLDSIGRYTLLLNINQVVSQPGFIGFLSTTIKDILLRYLTGEDETDLECFSGKRLTSLLKKFCLLPKGPETDLIEVSDTIISNLNLLRYLIIKDVHNKSGIWDSIGWIENDFLAELKKGIALSRAHYELQIKELSSVPNDTPVAVTVSGEPLLNMSNEQKKEVLFNALNTFDLMNSLAVRVTECIDTLKNSKLN